jgi:TRAP-type mannitol/chloroaromatic compound transport system substrate-binding protein
MIHNFINSDKWNELSSPYKLIVGTASSLANEWTLAKYDANNLAALKRLLKLGRAAAAVQSGCS